MVDHRPRGRRPLLVRNTTLPPPFQPPPCINNAIHRRPAKRDRRLTQPLIFMDDTALAGTPEHIIANCTAETGLRLQRPKCHLGLPITIAQCKSLPFPNAIQFHQDFNMVYLQGAPLALTRIVSLLSAMPYKHEAATLLRSTAAVCPVIYLPTSKQPLAKNSSRPWESQWTISGGNF